METSRDDASLLEIAGEGAAQAGVSLGKGAWDCDRNCGIPPEKEVRLLAESMSVWT